MREVLDAYRPQIDASDVLTRLGLDEGGYFLVSAHREENVDSPERLTMLLECLDAVRARWDLPIYVSTHPRTRKRLEALPGWTAPDGVTFHEPFGFHDFNRLQLGAACVLSDSGTIAEESTIMGFPAITLRDSIERPEALDTGGIMMTGLDAHDVVEAVAVAMAAKRTQAHIPGDYLIANTSERAVGFIMSTTRRHASWSGIRD
jgi:UDP-N-acetylglucosamine 2-epimerase (non-hydrolysing)